MYIIVDKNTKEILWVNRAPIQQNLSKKSVWHNYNSELYEWAKVPSSKNYEIPQYFDIIDNEVIEWTLQRQVDEGVLELSVYEKIVDNEIILKTREELLDEGIITQEEYDLELSSSTAVTESLKRDFLYDIYDRLDELDTGVNYGTTSFDFGANANNTGNRWLNTKSSTTSNLTPFIAPCNMKLYSVVFSNRYDGRDIDVELYKNGTKVHTLEVRNSEHSWKSYQNSNVTFNFGDAISAYIRIVDNSTRPSHVVVTYTFINTSLPISEGNR